MGICLLALVRSDEREAAERLLASLTTEERGHVHARQADAELALLQGRTAAAAEAFRALQHDSPAIALEVAVAYAEAGLHEEAERRFSELTDEPVYATRALVNLGMLRARAGDFAAAERFFTRALGLDPACAAAREALTRLRERPE